WTTCGRSWTALGPSAPFSWVAAREHAWKRSSPRPTRSAYRALRAGVSVFAVSSIKGSSSAMIDYHHGHLARDSREHPAALLDALAIEGAVDAGWTSRATPANPLTDRVSKPRRAPSRKSADVRWTPRPRIVGSPANRRG